MSNIVHLKMLSVMEQYLCRDKGDLECGGEVVCKGQ